jgi:hypothetical protein
MSPTNSRTPDVRSSSSYYICVLTQLPVFLDESGVTTKMARTHARAPPGKPALGTITAQDARGWFRPAGYALH